MHNLRSEEPVVVLASAFNYMAYILILKYTLLYIYLTYTDTNIENILPSEFFAGLVIGALGMQFVLGCIYTYYVLKSPEN